MVNVDFDTEEKAAIVAEWSRLKAEPPPFNPQPYGCLTFMMAAASLFLLPQLTQFGWKLSDQLGQLLLIVLLIVLAGGFLVGIFVGNGVYGRAHLRALESLEWLANHQDGMELDLRRRHAVSLQFNRVVSGHPGERETVALDKAKMVLGANLQYVIAVERVLAGEKLLDVQFGKA